MTDYSRGMRLYKYRPESRIILSACISPMMMRYTATPRSSAMSTHSLPQSVLTWAKALSPLGRTRSNASLAATQRLTGSAESGQQAPVQQPFSCMSSGRAKPSEVEAARRYYVDSV
jgi:hypothetical protein